MAVKQPPVDDAAAKAAPVIRHLGGAQETTTERLVKKYVPAWVVSGALHVAVILVAFYLIPAEAATKEQLPPPANIDPVPAAEEPPPEKVDPRLDNEDLGVKPDIDFNIPDAPLAKLTAESAEPPTEAPGAVVEREAPSTILPMGFDTATKSDSLGIEGRLGDFSSGLTGGGGSGTGPPVGFTGRGPGTRQQLLQRGGGSSGSEQAVAAGLAWLARKQKSVPNANPPRSYWEFDGSAKTEVVAATGMALLPFLAAGETHKTGKYRTQVEAGLRFLVGAMEASGRFKAPPGHYMYGHGIATIALCEAYGMTKDRNLLLAPAQLAINFIQRAQAPDGSWGYGPNAPGDTSIVGWQVQALQAARLTKDIKVDDAAVKRAMQFLNKVGTGERSLKSSYGYRSTDTAAPGTSLTAVGLLCRYYGDGWGPDKNDFAQGTLGLFGTPANNPGSVTRTDRRRAPNAARAPRGSTDADVGTPPDMYYYYYATQVVHFFEGPEWKEWNEGVRVNVLGARLRAGGMRDWLVNLQVKENTGSREDVRGSWKPDASHIGQSCGRLGTTCLALLTLEVYYRHLPLYGRKVTEMGDDR